MIDAEQFERFDFRHDLGATCEIDQVAATCPNVDLIERPVCLGDALVRGATFLIQEDSRRLKCIRRAPFHQLLLDDLARPIGVGGHGRRISLRLRDAHANVHTFVELAVPQSACKFRQGAIGCVGHE